MKNIIFTSSLLFSFFFLHAQVIEVQGELKVTTVNQNNTGTDVLVRNPNGTVEKRDASTIGGVPSTGIVLSEDENNTNLSNAGFTNLVFSKKATGIEIYGGWTISTSTGANCPGNRSDHTAIWSGTEMIVWGGLDFNSSPTNSGGRYNSSNNTWQSTSTTNAPSARIFHTAIWSINEMIIWGGNDYLDFLNSGGKYNPNTNTWTPTSTTNAPSARDSHTAIWTGTEMIIWGGIDNLTGNTNTGAKYNPTTDTWTPTSTTNAPSARVYHSAVWTGTEMIIWGGSNDTGTSFYNSGAKYNPSTDTWTTMATTNAPSARSNHTCVWTTLYGMVVWGGNINNVSFLNSGARYNPNTNSWISMGVGGLPAGTVQHYRPVWANNKILYWGNGELYSWSVPSQPIGVWTKLSNLNPPQTASGYLSVWTGDKMIIWGGSNTFVTNSGGIFDTTVPGYAPPTQKSFFLYKKN
jgi:N-acetylneuraminic acid mutarotase